MIRPSILQEKKLWKQGYRVVACIDEVGRGPLAGPVVACAVVLQNPKIKSQKPNLQSKIQKLRIKDSKQLSAKQREYWYNIVSSHPAIQWGIGRVSSQVIDRINIYQATKLAMQRAVRSLEKKLIQLQHRQYSNFCYSRKHYIIDFLILDGNMRLAIPLAQKSIIKGDEKIFSCAIASIIAKVRRDRLMVRYHKLYPNYGFDKHKGYGTSLHLAMLKKHGPCKIHRGSFGPVAHPIMTYIVQKTRGA